MLLTLATCLTALAALSSALTPASTSQPPNGNAIIHPELGELIPAGKSYTITWIPDVGAEVSLVLLRGPSTNAVPLLTIVEKIHNTGSYVWNPVPTTLEPDSSRYGIQLIVEGSGIYQYSSQFGVKNDAFSATSNATAHTTSSVSSTVRYVTYATASSPAGTGGNFSVPVVSPTRSMSVPATLQTTSANTATRSATGTASPVAGVSTGGAAKEDVALNAAGLLIAGLVGMYAF